MEEAKIDKRTKEYKSQTPIIDKTKIESLKEQGIPLKWVVLNYAILFSGARETAQKQFYDPSAMPRKEKAAKCWLTPNYVIIEKNYETKCLPASSINDNMIL